MPIPLGILAVAGAGGGSLANSYDLLEATVLTGTATTVTFSNLNNYSDYKHLELRYAIIGSTTNETIRLRFNGDLAVNYMTHVLTSSGSTVVSTSNSGSFIDLGEETFTTDRATPGIISVLDFASTTKNKTVRALTGHRANTLVALRGGLWINTNAITSLSILVAADSFRAGSCFAIYGIKG